MLTKQVENVCSDACHFQTSHIPILVPSSSHWHQNSSPPPIITLPFCSLLSPHSHCSFSTSCYLSQYIHSCVSTGIQLSFFSTLSNIHPSNSFWSLYNIVQAITFTREHANLLGQQMNPTEKGTIRTQACTPAIPQLPPLLANSSLLFSFLCRQITFQITLQRLIIMNQPNSVFTAMFFIILELNVGLVTNL